MLPFKLGFSARTRNDLIQNETSDFVRSLFRESTGLALIYDGTYLRHGKSANSCYQRKTYSMQKTTHLVKPFTICTTTGYVIDMLGPFEAVKNDAQIMQECFEKFGLGEFLREGDACFVDRGFRNVERYLQDRGLTVYMPSTKQGKQLTTEQANHSKCVTKIRWAVVAVHGMIKQKYRIFDQRIDNDMLPKIGILTRIACFLHNTFGKRLRSDQTVFDEVSERMLHLRNAPNTLAEEAEQNRWNLLRERTWIPVTSDSVPDFPEMTERDLKIFFTGTYQLSQSVSYLAEMLTTENTLTVMYHRDNTNILKLEVPSRHKKRSKYRCYIDYVPDSIGDSGVKRYYCECPNGKRTVGCCSHVAAVVYYLSCARYLPRIIRPAAILDSMFHDGASVPVIDEDSEED